MDKINIPNTNHSLHTELPQTNQNFLKVHSLEIGPKTQNIEENIHEEDLSMVVDNLVNLYFQEINKGKEEKLRKKFLLNYFNGYKINLQEIYYWLLNSKACSNSIYLLGYFNYHGIGVDINKQNAFNLYQKAAELEHMLAHFELANMYIDGEGTNKIFLKVTTSNSGKWRKAN